MTDEPLIKRVRETLRLSQRGFAKAVGKSYASIRLYEAGQKVPSNVLLIATGLCRDAGHPYLAKELEEYANKLGFDLINAPRLKAEETVNYCHAVLDDVLRSADTETVRMVMRMLQITADWSKPGKHAHMSIMAALSQEYKRTQKTEQEMPEGYYILRAEKEDA